VEPLVSEAYKLGKTFLENLRNKITENRYLIPSMEMDEKKFSSIKSDIKILSDNLAALKATVNFLADKLVEFEKSVNYKKSKK
jgi:predicted  nucleic acid-binding Zn-ribbon protein